MEPVKINATLDLQASLDAIKASKTLKDDKLVFEKLAEFQAVKDQLAAAKEQLDDVEQQVKQAINDRAKATYGNQWDSIVSDGYKITRSFTGSVFNVGDPAKVGDEFLKVELKPETKKIEDYIKSKGSLPEGLDYNPDRGESIRITVKA